MCTQAEFKQLLYGILKQHGLSAIGFFFAAWVYMDLQDNNRTMSDLVADQSRFIAEQTEVLRRLTEKIDNISR